MSLILVTGMPGVGKTTIIRKLSDELGKRNVPVAGFYTEEIRDKRSGDRVGFDVVSFEGSRAPLARTTDAGTRPSGPTVGRYSVCLAEFEHLAFPLLDQRHPVASSGKGVLLLDEIGRMEMKSRGFHDRMKAIVGEVATGKLRFVATIPLKASGIDVIEKLRAIPGCEVFHVKPSNRNQMYDDVLDAALRMLPSS